MVSWRKAGTLNAYFKAGIRNAIGEINVYGELLWTQAGPTANYHWLVWSHVIGMLIQEQSIEYRT